MRTPPIISQSTAIGTCRNERRPERELTHSSSWMIWLLVVSSLFCVESLLAATLSTDKADYFPGEYVIFSGSGWDGRRSAARKKSIRLGGGDVIA